MFPSFASRVRQEECFFRDVLAIPRRMNPKDREAAVSAISNCVHLGQRGAKQRIREITIVNGHLLVPLILYSPYEYVTCHHYMVGYTRCEYPPVVVKLHPLWQMFGIQNDTRSWRHGCIRNAARLSRVHCPRVCWDNHAHK